MTPEHTPGEPEVTPPPDPRLPTELRAARSLTDRSRPDEHATDDTPPPHPEAGPRLWPRVVGVLILLLGVGGAWIWQNPGFLQREFGGLAPAPAGQQQDASKLEALEARVARLEQRSPADLTPLSRRLDALEARVFAIGSATAPAGTDLGPLTARLDALEQEAAKPAADAQVAALAAKVDALADRDPAAALRARLDELTRQLGELTANQSKQTDATSQAERLARLEIALDAGRPLGTIPNAPPALAHFAAAAPPTEAALRLSFPAAEQEALKVSKPDTEGKPFVDQILERLRSFRLITVREGDHVVIGNATATTLARARVALDAGDLAGAARLVATLSGPPAEKVASWLADANALVAARQALAGLAGNG